MRRRTPGSTPAVVARLANKRQTLVVGRHDRRQRQPVRAARPRPQARSRRNDRKSGLPGYSCRRLRRRVAGRAVQNAIAAALAAAFSLPEFKSKASPPRIRSIRIVGLADKVDLDRVRAEANGNNIARWLTALPPNKLDANGYADALRVLAEGQRLVVQAYGNEGTGEARCRRLSCGRPGQRRRQRQHRPHALSPGRQRREARSQPGRQGHHLRHRRHQPEAVPVDARHARRHAGQRRCSWGRCWPFPSCSCPSPSTAGWLSPRTARARVLTSPRMLSSRRTASRSRRFTPTPRAAWRWPTHSSSRVANGRDSIFDYATLTGSCVNAITTRYSGVFTNRPDWHPRLKRTGHGSGERVWPFPIGKEFLAELKSDVADLMQCSVKGTGDHILAGSFLAEFIENDVPWIHMDLSASNHKGWSRTHPDRGDGLRCALHDEPAARREDPGS